MTEVEKLYKNAGVRYLIYVADTFPPVEYPQIDFNEKKQIELIKLLMEQEDFSWTIAQQGKDTEYAFYVGYEYSSGDFKKFTEALAGIINNLWQSLTDAERKQIKNILESEASLC